MIFGTSKQLFAKKKIIPGATETRNVYSRACRNKTGNCCPSVFSLLASVIGKTGATVNNLQRNSVCRYVVLLLTSYVSHVRLIMEYRCCVYNVGYLEEERRIKRLQRKWNRENDDLTGLGYVSRLGKIGLYSNK